MIYNTYQMYLADHCLYGQRSLESELAHAVEEGFTMGAKVVRGAYISGETAAGRGHRIQSTKQATDAAYDSATEKLLRSIARDSRCCASRPCTLGPHMSTHSSCDLGLTSRGAPVAGAARWLLRPTMRLPSAEP